MLYPVADLGFSPGGGGAPTPKSAIIFQFCPRKLHENERIWAPRGGARPWRPPLDPPMIPIDKKWMPGSSGRVWVQHLSSTQGHCRSPFGWWPNQILLVYVCKWVVGKKATAGMAISSGGHCRSPFPRWPWTQAQVVNSNSTSAGKETCHLTIHRVPTFLDWQNSLTFPVFFAIFQYFFNVLFF